MTHGDLLVLAEPLYGRTQLLHLRNGQIRDLASWEDWTFVASVHLSLHLPVLLLARFLPIVAMMPLIRGSAAAASMPSMTCFRVITGNIVESCSGNGRSKLICTSSSL